MRVQALSEGFERRADEVTGIMITCPPASSFFLSSPSSLAAVSASRIAYSMERC